MTASLTEIDERLKSFLAAILVICLPIAIAAYYLGDRMQQYITAPLLRLKEVSEDISEHGNYDYDLSHPSEDEIGALYGSFSAMTNARLYLVQKMTMALIFHCLLMPQFQESVWAVKSHSSLVT